MLDLTDEQIGTLVDDTFAQVDSNGSTITPMPPQCRGAHGVVRLTRATITHAHSFLLSRAGDGRISFDEYEQMVRAHPSFLQFLTIDTSSLFGRKDSFNED
jgi:hypothetical protein